MLDVEALSEMIAGLIGEEVEKAIAPLQTRINELEARDPVEGPQGEKGEKGDPGDNGSDGLAGADGKDGKDGRGVKDLLIDREGQLIATMDDGEMKSLGPILGKDGTDGTNGRDGQDAECLAEEDEMLISATLRKELGSDLIQLPDPIPFETKTQPPVHVTVENHLPKRGRERTVVTDYDERGRIAAYDRFET